MKTFINVLYRKILYKIPLKFLLLILVIVGVLYYNYSSAVDSFVLDDGFSHNLQMDPNSTWTPSYATLYDSYCIGTLGNSNSNCTSVTLIAGDSSITGNPYQNLVCLVGFNSNTLSISNNSNYTCTYGVTNFKLASLENNICTPMSSLQCQTEYNLIPISSVDQNYCTTNNLCPSCPSCPPSGGSGFSNVYINDILHIGAPTIVMNIPEEIDWDYGYTAGGYNMNIDVVGYNVDYDKIDSIVDNQSYKPSSEDFANILGILAPYTKIIVFFVFLFLVWAWIKKPFKSKKL